MRLLVPLDGSKRSEEILPWVGAFLKLPLTRVHVLHVATERSEAAEEDAPDRIPPDCISYATQAVKRLRGRSDRVEAHARVGDPAQEILRHAKDHGIDLTAMRTRCRQGISRFVFGSVTAEVLQESRLPILVIGPKARIPARPPTFDGILTPLDGSARSAKILDPTASLASAFGARIVLFHAFREKPNQRPFDEWSAQLRNRGLACETRIVSGDPAGQILGQVAESGFDLVAMATHGRSGVQRLLLGSVAEAVVASCAVPVLLLRSAGA